MEKYTMFMDWRNQYSENEYHSLGQDDTLGEEMAMHSSILAWKIPWTEEPSGLVHRVARSWKRLK